MYLMIKEIPLPRHFTLQAVKSIAVARRYLEEEALFSLACRHCSDLST